MTLHQSNRGAGAEGRPAEVPAVAAVPEGDPETGVVAYQVKPDDESALTKVIAHIGTWRDGSITRIGQELPRLVEARQGHPGIDFSHVSILTP